MGYGRTVNCNGRGARVVLCVDPIEVRKIITF
jgi:hypothetical protein